MSSYPGQEWAPDSVAQPAAAAGLWPAGNYEGDFISGTLVSSQIKGTPGFELRFNVGGTEKIVNIWLSDAAAEIATEQLAAVGWNGNVAKPEFAVSGPIRLYMKHDVYKGKQKEQWNISNFEAKAPPSASDPTLSRFAARFKNAIAAKKAAPPPPRPMPPPMQPRPTAPLPAQAAAVPPKAPPRPAPKAPAPPAAVDIPADRRATTQDGAWAVWVKANCEDAEMFYDAVERIANTNDPSIVTPEQWAQIANSAPPF